MSSAGRPTEVRRRRSVGPLARSFFLLSLLSLVAAGPVRAQKAPDFGVSPLNNLTFGTVLAGLSATVLPTDATAGELLINAPKDHLVILKLTLPPLAPAPEMTVTYTGAWANVNIPRRGTAFDPANQQSITMPSGGKVYVWIGGTLVVPQAQPAGPYSGVLTLSVDLY